MTECLTAPFGAWPSPVGASDVARANIRLSFPTVIADQVWWQELRPEEGGRTTVVHRAADGHRSELIAAPWNARTRVHEYGGRSYLPVPAARRNGTSTRLGGPLGHRFRELRGSAAVRGPGRRAAAAQRQGTRAGACRACAAAADA